MRSTPSAATTQSCSAPWGIRRCPTTSRSGVCCCRCGRDSTSGRTSAPPGWSNAWRYGYVLWGEIAEEVAAEHPQVTLERVLVDALAARMVSSPSSLDVVVASNLFGDVLTDIAAVLQGGMGMAASASLAPGSDTTPMFEPVHGSAPDIAGKGLANPIGAVWSAALMLEHLGENDASKRLMRALEDVCRDGPRTPDIGGNVSTSQVGDAIARKVADV